MHWLYDLSAYALKVIFGDYMNPKRGLDISSGIQGIERNTVLDEGRSR